MPLRLASGMRQGRWTRFFYRLAKPISAPLCEDGETTSTFPGGASGNGREEKPSPMRLLIIFVSLAICLSNVSSHIQ